MNILEITSNINSNHYQRIIDIAERSDAIYIISPFLMESFDSVIQDFKEKGVDEVHLVTTLNVDSNIQRKVLALHSFYTSCTEAGIKYHIYEDGALHGKIYIGMLDGDYECGMLSSANFTAKGLYKNHEWGIWIEDIETLKALKDEVFSVCSEPLTTDELFGIFKKVDDYFKLKPITEPPRIDLSIKEFIRYRNSKPVRSEKIKRLHPDCRYVLKPVGSSSDPFIDGRKPSEISHVSDTYVKYIHEGAILIYYGIGASRFLGCYEVISPPEKTGTYDRWPWEIRTRNLYPNYSDNWERFENAFSRVNREYPDGAKDMNKIKVSWGAIPISEDFGKYLVGIIEEGSKSYEG